MRAWMDSVLTPLITPERKEIMLDVIVSLEQLNYETALDEIQQVVEMSGSFCDNAMLLARIDDVIFTAHETIFKQHMLKISADASMLVRKSVVDMLMGLNVYIMPEHVLGLFEAELTAEEIISEICELFTEVQADEVWPHIEWVDPALLTAIKNEVKARVMYREEAVDPTVHHNRIKLLNKLFIMVGRDKFSLVNELTNNGVRVGAVNFTSLLLQSLESIERRPLSERAVETLGLAILSDLPLEKLDRTMRVAIDDLSDGGMGVADMLATIKPLLAEVSKLNEST